jgi:hypothetical protein
MTWEIIIAIVITVAAMSLYGARQAVLSLHKLT